MMSRPDFLYKQVIFYSALDKDVLSFRADNLLITDSQKNVRLQHSCHKTFALFIIGNITITSVLLKKAKAFGFPIFLLGSNFHLDSVIGNIAEGNTPLRKKQYSAGSLANIIARNLIEQKIRNQAALLRKNRPPSVLDRATANDLDLIAEDLPENADLLRGKEGAASHLFFQVYFKNLDWKRRAPRCKEDTTNLLLDIGYTYLFNFMESLLALYGFDIYCGVFHTFFYHRKSLVCDIVEPFRCIIDHRIRKAHALSQINPDDFFYEKDHWELMYAKQIKYIRLFMKDILERKEELFLFVRQYYLWFMQDNPQTNSFPVFHI
ncbi:MAG: type V CRISPR-associated endonuclease Cas1 [Lentisphaeria bacterium]|nr:type V CRISPR-associated endonuclease Cas1 [Lentisphaeria bacterium]